MGSILNPYIVFDGDARAALEFYQSVLGGDVQVMPFSAMGVPGPEGERVMHGQLSTPKGYTLMVSDVPPQTDVNLTSGRFTISLSGDDPELADYFAKLAEGGKVGMELKQQAWGDTYGDLIDRFGIAWCVNIAGQQG